ncbi:MAG: SigE family RNA polymerase sigma factor [Jatrophihabitans sp.]|uniref:SigE family RNA polymerase sigma factor n=1 Tax=Jatrophihabitans sp. TaxID=1932789 RepID=UPI003F80007F
MATGSPRDATRRGGVGVGAATGADAGVAALFHAHRLALVRLAVLLVDDRETAEDVVQDAFAALHRRWGGLASEDAALAYLRTCVVNGSRSVLRRRRTVRTKGRPPWDEQTAPADEPVLLAADHRAVLAALGRLAHRQREVLVLRYWADLSEAEIAATLGISAGAVKSTASRARDALAALLAEEGF